VECVRMLLDCGAVFRDADFQPEAPMPFVCANMLSGAGYAPPPLGGPSGSAPRRVPRGAYLDILSLLLERGTFCEGLEDKELVRRTLATLRDVEPPPDPAAVAAAARARPSTAEAEAAAEGMDVIEAAKAAGMATPAALAPAPTDPSAEIEDECAVDVARRAFARGIEMALEAEEGAAVKLS